MRKIAKILLSLGVVVSMVFSGQYISGGTDGSNYANAATKVKINKKYATLSIGETVKLKITGTKKKVTWKSSNKKIATVTSKGKVKGIKEGMTTITATVDKKKYKCTIIVEEYEDIPAEEVTDVSTTEVPTPVSQTQVPVSLTPIPTETVQNSYAPTVAPDATETQVPTPTEVPIVSQEVTQAPTETPSVNESSSPTNTIKDNYEKIGKYILENGETNSNGEKYIYSYLNSTKYGIVYIPTTSSYRFIAYDISDVNLVYSISLDVDDCNFEDCKIQCYIKGSGDNGQVLNTTTEVKNITKNSNLDWSIEDSSIPQVDYYWRKMADEVLNIGVIGWDYVLSRKLNMRITDLGFGTDV